MAGLGALLSRSRLGRGGPVSLGGVFGPALGDNAAGLGPLGVLPPGGGGCDDGFPIGADSAANSGGA